MNDAFAKKFRMLREERDVTILDFSRATGISRSTVHRWERGEHCPSSAETIKIVTEYLAVTPEDLGLEIKVKDPIQNHPVVKDIMERLKNLEEKLEFRKEDGQI